MALPRIYDPPSPIPDPSVDAWLESPSLVLLTERADRWRALADMIGAGGITGPKIHDARMAAICAAAGARELWTVDRDLSRLAVRTRNPLSS